MKYKILSGGHQYQIPGFQWQFGVIGHHRRPFLCTEDMSLDFQNQRVIWDIYPSDSYSMHLLYDTHPGISSYTGYFSLNTYNKRNKPGSLRGCKLNHVTWTKTVEDSISFIQEDITGGKRFILPFIYLDRRLSDPYYATYNNPGHNHGQTFIVPFRLILISNERVRFAGEAKYILFTEVHEGSYSQAILSSYEEFIEAHPSFRQNK